MNAFPTDVVEDFHRFLAAEHVATGRGTILRVELPTRGMLWTGALGHVEPAGEPVSPASPFRIASITKTFTAAVIVQLASEGRLDFDDPMHLHLPAEIIDLVPRIHVLEGRSYGDSITVRDLLTHAAGLFDYASCDQFFAAIFESPEMHWTPRKMLEGAIHWGAPSFAPRQGYGYAYSDTGYVLLGCIIEELHRAPLHAVYRERILDPLGLSNTYLEGFEEHRGSPMTHPFQGEWDAARIHGSADWAGGGLVSTADEISVFARALATGRVVPMDLMDEMFEWRFRELDPEKHSLGFIGYSMGIEARRLHDVLLRGHRGHWGSWMHVEPLSGLTVTGTVNQAERRPDSIVSGVIESLVDSGLLERAA